MGNKTTKYPSPIRVEPVAESDKLYGLLQIQLDPITAQVIKEEWWTVDNVIWYTSNMTIASVQAIRMRRYLGGVWRVKELGEWLNEQPVIIEPQPKERTIG